MRRMHVLLLLGALAIGPLAPRTGLAQHLAAAGAQAEEEAARPFWSDRARGWHFYEEPPPDLEERPRPPHLSKPPATAEPAHVPTAPELAEFKRLQQALEDSRHIAIMRPTEANVRRYMALEAQVVQRASTFADVAQRVAWSTPALDPTLQGRPVNAQALELFEHAQRRDRSATIATLGQDHVLLFFYRSDCPYCHAFAPTLEAFQDHHGLQIVAVSLDGGPMPGFPAARPDNGIATALQVAQVPAVYLAQPTAGRIVPIGFGVLSEAQLLERIAIVSAPMDSGRRLDATQQRSLP